MVNEKRSFGRYRLVERLGGGGMAEVWRAEVAYSADVSKVVALKMIREELVRVPHFLSLFIDEARITSRISHANVAQVFDYGEEAGRPFLAMELVEGPDLETILNRARELGQHLPLSFCAHVVADVARGLAAAHGLADAAGKPYGVVHRDVSPQNVLVSYAGEVKLTDFGIARARDKLTQTETGTVMGKFRYMSPEQVRGEPLDARSDLFSCGVLLYELLTGLHLFDGRTSAEVVDQIRYKSLPDLVALRRDVDPALESVLRWTLERDPAARCPDAAMIARDLERYIHVAHPQFTRDDVAQLVGALLPRRSPGRVGPMAFAGTELAAAGEGAPPATGDDVSEPDPVGSAPGQVKRTLAGTGSEPVVPSTTTPGKRTVAGGPTTRTPSVALTTTETPVPLAHSGPTLPPDPTAEEDDDAVPLAPMGAKPTQAFDGTWGPVASPGPTPAAPPATAAPPAEPGAPSELAEALTAALDGEDPNATAPTRRAEAADPAPGPSPPDQALEATRTQARPGRHPAEPAPPRPQSRRLGTGLGVVLALLLVGGIGLAILWARLEVGSGNKGRSGTPARLDASASAALSDAGDAAAPQATTDAGAPNAQARIAELDGQLAQLPLLRGPRHERVLRALALAVAWRLRHATVDEKGERRLGPPPPAALRLPAGDPLRDSLASAADVLAERLLLGAPFPPQAASLLQPLPATLPGQPELLKQFPGTALYALASPESALAQELHLRAMGWQKAWRPPLAGAGGRRYLWPHLVVARDAVARLLERDPRHGLGQALRRYLDARPKGQEAHLGALAARIKDVRRLPVKKSPTVAMHVTLVLRNTDDQQPLTLQPGAWRLHGAGPAPREPSYWMPESIAPLAPGKTLELTVTFAVPSGAPAPALVLSVAPSGGGALWLQVGAELLP